MKQFEFNQKVSGESKPLTGFALKLTHNMEDAEDLLQDTMLKAFSNKEKLQFSSHLVKN